ncbi:hypothetical protein ABV038_001156 [Salmonella enterica]|nr:hypothetical protein [Salmonella enterica subsp. enterica serovar Infantis]
MRIPYHPLTHQQLNLPGNDEGLTEDEKQELIDIFPLLFSLIAIVTAGGFSFIFFFFLTLYIFG